MQARRPEREPRLGSVEKKTALSARRGPGSGALPGSGPPPTAGGAHPPRRGRPRTRISTPAPISPTPRQAQGEIPPNPPPAAGLRAEGALVGEGSGDGDAVGVSGAGRDGRVGVGEGGIAVGAAGPWLSPSERAGVGVLAGTREGVPVWPIRVGVGEGPDVGDGVASGPGGLVGGGSVGAGGGAGVGEARIGVRVGTVCRAGDRPGAAHNSALPNRLRASTSPRPIPHRIRLIDPSYSGIKETALPQRIAICLTAWGAGCRWLPASTTHRSQAGRLHITTRKGDRLMSLVN